MSDDKDTRPMLETILERLNGIRDELSQLRSDFDRLRLDVRGDIRGIERQIAVLNGHILKMQTNQTVIEDRLDQVESKVS
jgi:hypothetical protein